MSNVWKYAMSRNILDLEPIEEREQKNPMQVQRNYSNEQLLLFLHDKKNASGRRHALIKEIPSDTDLHPINILAAVDADMTKDLEASYIFFLGTSYSNQCTTSRRERSTKAGHHCWSQGGGKTPIFDAARKTILGFSRTLKFIEKPKRQKKAETMIGSTPYIFRLQELITAEDEEQEKKMASEKRHPESFLCIYKLSAIRQSNQKDTNNIIPSPVDDQHLNTAQALPSSSNLDGPTIGFSLDFDYRYEQSARPFLMDFKSGYLLPRIASNVDVSHFEFGSPLPLGEVDGTSFNFDV